MGLQHIWKPQYRQQPTTPNEFIVPPIDTVECPRAPVFWWEGNVRFSAWEVYSDSPHMRRLGQIIVRETPLGAKDYFIAIDTPEEPRG